jgi:D-alanyl-D-alanine carboxypeptidase/D-alanyl-D-alanine-endopeptidase (penicillin-binding protein 4)
MQFKSAWCIIFVFGLRLFLQSQIQNELPVGFTETDLKGASLSIHVMDYEQGTTLYAYDAERLLIPASIQKLLSTGAAMEHFGPEYQFKTSLGVCKSKTQAISKHSLIIYGSGDRIFFQMKRPACFQNGPRL